MIKKSFIGLAKPHLEYERLEDTPKIEKIPNPEKVTFLIDALYNKKKALLKKGAAVKTGQKLAVYENKYDYFTSSVAGKVSSLSSYPGNFGKSYTAIEVEVADGETDDQFSQVANKPSIDNISDFLAFSPGNPSIKSFSNSEKPINSIVVCGVDQDLLITTNQYVVKSNIEAVKKGIEILKAVTRVDNIILVVSEAQAQSVSSSGTGIKIKQVDSKYPAALPQLIAKNLLGKVIPAGKTCEDMGICFISAEAVASIGDAFEKGHIPTTKILTLIKKDGSKVLVSAKIGTPVGNIFETLNITVNEKDKIIFGGPMTGSAVYSLDHPVQPDTDAIIVQDKEDIPVFSNYPCINCGECVRICPANIQINLLVRFLETGQYQEAADQYDLYSCIECGLCSYVCVSGMPIFQYIRSAKYELGRANTAEATNG